MKKTYFSPEVEMEFLVADVIMVSISTTPIGGDDWGVQDEL